MIVVCDTGPLVAAGARRDQHHDLCAGIINELGNHSVLIVPITVTVEVDYLLRSRVDLDSARRFLFDLEAGVFLSDPVDDDVLSRAVAIDREYADADLGLVDASVIAVAERMQADAILTLDHAHFRLVRGLPCPLRPEEHELS